MVSSAILEQTCTSEFFKDYQNCTSSMDECNLKSLKNSRVYVFSNCTRNHILLLIIYMKKLCSHLEIKKIKKFEK